MKASMSSPYAIREIALQIEEVLGLNLGIPMNAEISNMPTTCDEDNIGTYTIHWECGWHANGRVLVGIHEHISGRYQSVRLVSLRFRRPFRRVNRRDGAADQPLPSSTMSALDTIGASMHYAGNRFTLRLTEEELGNVRPLVELNRIKATGV